MSSTRSHSGATADMRSSINNQIQHWATRANWVDDEKAERVFWKMGHATEDYISPNPETCGSYREEASRIYQEIKDEYGLRTVREARKEARDYDDRAKQAAAKTLRDNLDAIDSGEREQLVDDIEDEFGEDFVRDVLSAARADVKDPAGGSFPEPREPESHTYEFEGIDETEDAPDEPEPAPEPEPEPEPAELEDPESAILSVAARLPRPVRSIVVSMWVFVRWEPGDSIARETTANHTTA